jgi:hypothetical protein
MAENQSTGEMKFHKTLTLSTNRGSDDKSFKRGGQKSAGKGSTSSITSMESKGMKKSDTSATIGKQK